MMKTTNIQLNKTDKQGYNCLHIAAQYPNLEIIKLLREANVYYLASKNGTTPLHLACKSGCFEIVKYMIEEMNIEPTEVRV